jgi:hypothetical protein
MLTLITTLVGALLGFVPELFKIFKDKSDKEHELKLIDLQMKQAELGHDQRMAEINTSADISESNAIYRTYKTGIQWIDGYNGTVRPTIAYAFFGLYSFVKAIVIYNVILHVGSTEMPVFLLKDTLAMVWSEEDSAALFGILGFYYGNRAMSKGRAK